MCTEALSDPLVASSRDAFDLMPSRALLQIIVVVEWIEVYSVTSCAIS